MLGIKSKGVLLLCTNDAVKINKCAINFGLKKLTIEKMISPRINFGVGKWAIGEMINPSPPGNMLYTKRRFGRKLA